LDPRRIADFEGANEDETLEFLFEVVDSLKSIYIRIAKALSASLPLAISRATETIATFIGGLGGLKSDAVPAYVNEHKGGLASALDELAVCFEFASDGQKEEITTLWNSLVKNKPIVSNQVLARLDLYNSPLDRAIRGEQEFYAQQFLLDAAE
jgi:hypothetical protein